MTSRQRSQAPAISLLPQVAALPHSAPRPRGLLISWNHATRILVSIPATWCSEFLFLCAQPFRGRPWGPTRVSSDTPSFASAPRTGLPPPASPRALAARSRLLRCLPRAITVHRLLQQAAVRQHFISLQRDACARAHACRRR